MGYGVVCRMVGVASRVVGCEEVKNVTAVKLFAGGGDISI